MSTAALPDAAAALTLFIDRDLWSRRLDAALREAGIPFVAHRDLFALPWGDLSAAETATLSVTAWPAVQRAVMRYPAPAILFITRGARVDWLKG